MKPRLPVHEWCIVVLFCSILFVLSAYALTGHQQVPLPSPPVETKPATVEVKIEGQVAKPGSYALPKKSSLKELLAQAEPLSTADLSQLNFRRKLRDGQTIIVPERQWITIQLTGMVEEPGPLKILSGTRIQELVPQLKVLPEADIKALSKRRSFLYEGDALEVRPKKGKKKSASKSPAQEENLEKE